MLTEEVEESGAFAVLRSVLRYKKIGADVEFDKKIICGAE